MGNDKKWIYKNDYFADISLILQIKNDGAMTTVTQIAKLTYLVFILLLTTACGGGSDDPAKPEEKPKNEVISGKALSYTTTADKSKLFESKEIIFDRTTSVPGSVAVTEVAIDPTVKHQTIDGFGAAMTWASCYNLLKMAPGERMELLQHLFGKEGLGISLIRVSIGASDFNLEEYTWCDEEGIENFEMHPSDRDVVIPILKAIYLINPDVKIIASPWSCPRWMKQRTVSDGRDHYSWTSGSLRPYYYKDYATYFVKWIQTMESEGFNIYALTIQNEPLNHGNSMSLYMGWIEQANFIKSALGPAFKEAGIKTKILVFDHNYNYDNYGDQKNYPLKIYADKVANEYVAGSAWHNYGGNVSELQNIVKNAPDKEIYFTEASIGSWNYNFGTSLINDFSSIFMQTLAHECKGITLWNMVLDNNNGPYSPQNGSCKTCYGVVTMSSASGTIIDKTSHYYNIAHASKVIRSGAVRIDATGRSGSGVSYQAFQNPDGSFGVIVLNSNTDAHVFRFKGPKHTIETIVPGKAINSLIWSE